MPVMKLTVSFTVPDAGLHALKRCVYLFERPLYGFMKTMVERQAKWAPQGARIDRMELDVVIETSEGERTHREAEQQALRDTRDLIRRANAKGYRTSALRSDERLAA